MIGMVACRWMPPVRHLSGEVESKINVPASWTQRVSGKTGPSTRRRLAFQNRPFVSHSGPVQKVRGAGTSYPPRFSSLDTTLNLDRKDVEGGRENFPWVQYSAQ